MKFEIRSGKERLITPTGLGIAGLLLNKTDFKKRVDGIKLKGNANPQIKNSDGPSPISACYARGKAILKM